MHPFKTVKTFVRFAIASALLLIPAAVGAASVTWTNASGGNWSAPGNWSPNTVPGAGDSAMITTSGSYTVTLDVNATVDNLTVGGGSGTQTLAASSGTFTLNGTVAITGNGAMALSSTTLGGNGTWTNEGTINNNNSTINAALVNQGLMVFRGVNNNLGGSFVNQGGATLRVLGASVFGDSILNVANGFTNSGVIELTSVVEVQPATLNVSNGTLVNAAGGQINALPGSGGPRTLGMHLDNQGTVTIDRALTLNGSSADHLNSGTIILNGGQTFQVNGGTFQIVPGGVLQGNGTVNAVNTVFSNDGLVNPGNPTGTTSFVGSFPQTSNGSLSIDIGGPAAGVDYDQLNISGQATFGGVLNIRLINGFRPSGGDRFEIIHYTSHAGFFDHINGLDIGGGFFLQPLFTATNIVLTTVDARPRPVFQSGKRLSGGQIEFTLGETAGQDFVIEAATDLISPVWIPILTNTSSGAIFNFIVTDATNFSQRFFRTRQ